MMTIYLNRDGRTTLDTPIQENIQPEVFEEPVIREALRDIDRVVEISGLALITKEYGVLSPNSLSNGCKALILLWYSSFRDLGFLVSNCCMGENVLPYLAALSLKCDFNISMDYPMLFPDLNVPLFAKDFDTGTEFHTGDDVFEFYLGKAGVTW